VLDCWLAYRGTLLTFGAPMTMQEHARRLYVKKCVIEPCKK